MDAVSELFAALDRDDAAAVRLALHPYVGRTRADGTLVRGRNNVLGDLAARRPSPPSAVELRSGQIYRCAE